MNPRHQYRSPPRNQERVDKDRKSRRIGYEGSLAGEEVNPHHQCRSPPRKQERVDKDRKSRRIGYEGSLAGEEVNPRHQCQERVGKNRESRVLKDHESERG